jgi:Protein of unknown function (DUF4035)
MLAQMPSHLLTEWMAYARLEPFGPLREDHRAGTLAALLANINRDRKAQPDAFRPGDFFATLLPDGERDGPDPEDVMQMQIEQFMAIGLAFGALSPDAETT